MKSLAGQFRLISIDSNRFPIFACCPLCSTEFLLGEFELELGDRSNWVEIAEQLLRALEVSIPKESLVCCGLVAA